MQTDQHCYLKKAMPPNANQVHNMKIPISSALSPATKNLGPFNGFEFQPSEICPRNFIIFDHNDNRSQIMFHPTIAHKFSGPPANICADYIQEKCNAAEENCDEIKNLSPFQEDSDDIDALLSFEEEDEEDFDEEVVSTARTCLNDGSASPESCSNYVSKRGKNKSSSSQKSSHGGNSCNNKRKQKNMKKMVRTLRGIVPGGNQMTTVDVLDEAVKYLKSLKMEVQKLGFKDWEN